MRAWTTKKPPSPRASPNLRNGKIQPHHRNLGKSKILRGITILKRQSVNEQINGLRDAWHIQHVIIIFCTAFLQFLYCWVSRIGLASSLINRFIQQGSISLQFDPGLSSYKYTTIKTLAPFFFLSFSSSCSPLFLKKKRTHYRKIYTNNWIMCPTASSTTKPPSLVEELKAKACLLYTSRCV